MATARAELARQLEGWQLGVLTLTMALLATTLSVPRPVRPRELPLPQVDRSEESRSLREDVARAEGAEQHPLPYEVRAVGELVRRFGEAERGASQRMPEALGQLREAAALAYQRHGLTPLLALRAVQLQLFFQAVQTFQETGRITADLNQLGGDFLNKARRIGWLTAAHNVSLNERELSALFRVRWSLLVGLEQNRRLSPTLNDWRAYHHAWLGSLLRAELPDLERVPLLASHVTALARRDPSYPADLALGILALQQGRAAEARGALVRHLTGPLQQVWQVRARNYLALAVAEAGAPE